MFRTLAASTLALFVGVAILTAAEYKNALITKVDGDKVTFKVDDKEMTIALDKDVKITAMKKNDKVDLDKEAFTKAVATAVEKSKAKALRATITTDGEGDKQVIKKIEAGGKKNAN